MPRTNLGAIFGVTSSQSIDDIIIPKSELLLTAKDVNNEEQILAAIIKRARPNLSAEYFPKYLQQNITIEDGITDRVYRTEDGTEIPYLRTQVIVSFHKRDIDRTGGIFPDEY
jgi:hypothetical protein